MRSQVTVSVDPAAVKEAIDESVRLAVAQALGPHKDALVKAIVDAALAKPRGGYGQSPFAQSLDAQIREEAKAAVHELIVEEGPRIRAALKARLTADGMVDAILRQVLEVRPVFVQVDLRSTDPEDDGVEQ
ncbi:MAG: hypothetical protein KF809_14965 [Chloroflexi bacterium]|nr:hypothetical protein [Chloroflexota bacterium]